MRVLAAVVLVASCATGCVEYVTRYDVPVTMCTYVEDEAAVGCLLERVREGSDRAPRADFDDVARWLARGGWERFEHLGREAEAEASLRALSTKAWNGVETLAAEGRTDLARRRAAFICAAWDERGRSCPYASRREALEERARAFHRAAGDMLEPAWPAAARLHRCLEDRSAAHCQPLTAEEIRTGSGHVELELVVSPECPHFTQHPEWERIHDDAFGAAGPRLGRVKLEITACELEPLHVEKINDRCVYPVQAVDKVGKRAARAHQLAGATAEEPARVERASRRYTITGKMDLVDGKSFHRGFQRPYFEHWVHGTTVPIAVRFEAQREEVESEHCDEVWTQAWEAHDDDGAMEAGAFAVLGSTLQRLMLLPSRPVDYTFLFGEAFQRGAFAEAEHWAVFTHHRPRSDVREPGWTWIVERYGARVGRVEDGGWGRVSHASELPRWAPSDVGYVANDALLPFFRADR